MTETNDIWADDLLDRKKDADFLIRFLTNRSKERAAKDLGSYVLNIDASWGAGKTFFLHRLKHQLEREGYVTAYCNAWENDHADDPLLPLLAAIDNALKPFSDSVIKKLGRETIKAGGRVAVSAGILVAKGLVQNTVGSDAFKDLGDLGKNALGHAANQLLDQAAEASLAAFFEQKKSTNEFKEKLQKYLGSLESRGHKLPLIVIIDELDRCRPSYAIATLERIKHLFNLNHVVFIAATDTDQLSESIKAVYGSGFDSRQYLTRFFDRAYVFEIPILNNFVDQLFAKIEPVFLDKLSSNEKYHHPQDFFLDASVHFDLTPREVGRCFDMLHTILTIWPYHVNIQLVYMLPLIIAFQTNNKIVFQNLSDGNASSLSAPKFNKIDALMLKFRNHARGASPNFQSLRQTLNALFVSFGTSLPEYTRQIPPEGIERWIYEIYTQEFQYIHGNSYRTDALPFTILRKYPELVRNAGKLVMIEEETN